ncbi:MAG: GTPase Era [Gammaproteobacteria bacterium]
MTDATDSPALRSGMVGIFGRPNVGKSTLMNRVLGQKIAITSPKPQTTRHRILGIHTTDDMQAVFVDTPGLHLNAKRAMNRYLNRAASNVMAEVDVAVFVTDALRWTDEDEDVLKRLTNFHGPVVLVVNKIDTVKDKEALLPHLKALGERRDFATVVPLSARKGSNIDAFETALRELLPHTDRFYPEDQITDRSERFLAAEIVREKLIMALDQELPYAITVEIESFKRDEAGKIEIHALIWVERDGQKRIVIGKGGAVLKDVGRKARLELRDMLETPVHLQLWVKVKSGWADNERALQGLGYDS